MQLQKTYIRANRLKEAVRFVFRLAKVRVFGMLLYKRVLVKARHHYKFRNEDLPQEIEILSPFWGERFASMFVDSCLPSVLQSGVDKLCREIPTRLSICCPLSDWYEIKNKVLETVGDLPIDVQWIPLESPDGYSKSRLMSFVRSRVAASINVDRVIVFAFPDLIFGRGLDRLIADSERGVYVVCFQIRTSFELGAKFLKSVIKEAQYRNRDLVNLGIKVYPHTITRLAFEERHDYLHLSKRHNMYLAYFKEPPPVLMRGSALTFELGFSNPFFGEFECLDHDIPDLMLKHGMLRAVDDSEYFCWLEQTPESQYQKMISNSFNLESALYLKRLGVKLRITGD